MLTVSNFSLGTYTHLKIAFLITTNLFSFVSHFREETEDSDGISVISESEMYKNHTNSDNELEKPQISEEIQEEVGENEEEIVENRQESSDENPSLLTPPSTPNEITAEDEKSQEKALKAYDDENALKELEQQSEASKCHKNNHGLLLLFGMSLIIAVLYTNVSSLKNELTRTVNVYEQRILRLEEENQILRSRLDELMQKLKDDTFASNVVTQQSHSPTHPHEKKIYRQANDENNNVKQLPPITKDVWLGGGEKEELVKLLDKKYNSLPDYCYFTDENDLFYEYNMENCEKKKQKMEERIKKLQEKREKFQKEKPVFEAKDTVTATASNEKVDANDDKDKFSVDDIWKSNDKMFNDFMSKTADEILASLNDEIQEIKNSRFDPMPSSKNDNNNDNNNFDKNVNKKHQENSKMIDDKLKDGDNKKAFTKDKPNGNNNKNKQEQQDKKNQYDGSVNRDDKKWKDKKRDEKFKDDDKSAGKKQQQQRRQSKRRDSKDSGDWVEQRTKGREDARIKKDDGENWYLKRKNDREIHRLEPLNN